MSNLMNYVKLNGACQKGEKKITADTGEEKNPPN